jgi:hypothetical protein
MLLSGQARAIIDAMAKRSFILILFVCVLMLTAAHAQVLTFEGLQSGEQVLNFYNGGNGGNGTGPGPSYGITFGTSVLALTETNGNFALEPSPVTIVYFVSGPGVIMNKAAGFTTGFSFYYASAVNTGTVTVWDGLNGTGTLLATLNLPATGSYCGGSTKAYSCWNTFGVTFSGTAKSVDFGGTANGIGFDNITLGSATPGTVAVPVPALSTWGMLAAAAMLMFTGLLMMKRYRQSH